MFDRELQLMNYNNYYYYHSSKMNSPRINNILSRNTTVESNLTSVICLCPEEYMTG